MSPQRGFFAHLVTSNEVEHSHDLIFHPNLETAYLDVVAAIPEIAADLLRRGLDPMLCAFRICDEDDRLLETVHFGELVRGRVGTPEPRSQDLLLPVYGCTLRDRARQACHQLRLTIGETRELLEASRNLQLRIEKFRRNGSYRSGN